MSTLRILHLLASPYWSGPAEIIFDLALAQRAAGHEVFVCVDTKRRVAPSEELAVPRFEAGGVLADHGMELSTRSTPLGMWRDRAILRRLELDIVHAHMSHDHFLASLGRPRAALLVRSIHAPRSLRRLMPPADAYTVPSSRERERLARAQSMVLPAFAGPDFVPSQDRPGLRRALGVIGDPVIGMVSTFQPSRRHDLGLEAFERLLQHRPDARLYLVGDGVLTDTLRDQARGLGIEARVRFVGYQSGADFLRWLQVLDEVWILGLGNDYGGRAAMQARAVGVRVVAVDEGGLAQAADVLLSSTDPEALWRASEAGARRELEVIRRELVAERVLELYRAARAS